MSTIDIIDTAIAALTGASRALAADARGMRALDCDIEGLLAELAAAAEDRDDHHSVRWRNAPSVPYDEQPAEQRGDWERCYERHERAVAAIISYARGRAVAQAMTVAGQPDAEPCPDTVAPWPTSLDEPIELDPTAADTDTTITETT